MRITVIGTGYVGLVTGACFAELGHRVVCLEADREKLRSLESGQIPFFEPGVARLVARNRTRRRLSFTADRAAAIADSPILFIAVGTPTGRDGRADLSAVRAVAADIARFGRGRQLVVTKSTVPVGTTEAVAGAINRARRGRGTVDVASNPEFLREGSAVADFLKPDRIVVGTASLRARRLFEGLYASFAKRGVPVVYTDIRSAELIKYASNAFLATKVSFINEVANYCELVGADALEVSRGVGLDSRIGSKFLQPGIGYGGSCFPKDVVALIADGARRRHPFRILRAVERVNFLQWRRVATRIETALSGRRSPTVAVWGLSFKPNTSDMRKAPAVAIINYVLRRRSHVAVWDPAAMGEAKRLFRNRIRYGRDQYECLTGASLLIVLTEWPAFRTPDFSRMRRRMTHAQLIDARNMYHPDTVARLGFSYWGIGRRIEKQ